MFVVAAVFGFAALFWASVVLVFRLGLVILIAVVRLVLWLYDQWRENHDPANHPEWWAERLAQHPHGSWL